MIHDCNDKIASSWKLSSSLSNRRSQVSYTKLITGVNLSINVTPVLQKFYPRDISEQGSLKTRHMFDVNELCIEASINRRFLISSLSKLCCNRNNTRRRGTNKSVFHGRNNNSWQLAKCVKPDSGNRERVTQKCSATSVTGENKIGGKSKRINVEQNPFGRRYRPFPDVSHSFPSSAVTNNLDSRAPAVNNSAGPRNSPL